MARIVDKHRIDHFLGRGGNGEVNGFGGVEQAIDVLLQPEHAAVVKTNALKDAVTIKQTVIEDRNLRVGLIIKLSIDVNSSVKCSWENGGTGKMVNR